MSLVELRLLHDPFFSFSLPLVLLQAPSLLPDARACSDNGGPLETMTNHPLRGGKFSDFEGGVRSAAFVSGGLLPASARGTTSNGYVMLADWYTTFSHLAGIDATDAKAERAGLPPPDGLDMWPMLSGRNRTSPRTELPISSHTLTVGDWKIMTSTQRYNTWTPLTGWPPDFECRDRNSSKPLRCSADKPCLFNVREDPNERVDLSRRNSTVLRRMMASLRSMQATVWHNCDPPSVCEQINASTYCENAHTLYGDVYGPMR